MYKDECWVDGHKGHIVVNKWEETNEEYKLTVAFKSQDGKEVSKLLNNTIVDFKCDDMGIDTSVAIDLSYGGYHQGENLYLVLILRKINK